MHTHINIYTNTSNQKKPCDERHACAMAPRCCQLNSHTHIQHAHANAKLRTQTATEMETGKETKKETETEPETESETETETKIET